MALSIRSAEVERLARELARQSGGTMTEAIGEALEARLLSFDGEARRRRAALARIAADCARAPDLDTRSAEDILGYDEDGAFSHGDR